MDSINGESSAIELREALGLVWNYSFKYVNSMSLKCAIDLGIPDIIHKEGQPITLSKLVSALGVHANKAHCILRLMRILVHSGFFAQQLDQNEQEEELYLLTPASRLLLKDNSMNAAPFVLLVADPIFTTSFTFLSTWLRNDDSSVFETARGKNFWDCVAEEPRLRNLFYENMVSDSRLISRYLIENFKDVFIGFKSLIDVGGGTGTMAEAIAKAFPEIECTVFDLPHIVVNLQGTKNLAFVGGDMFQSIPSADAVLLKWILHDWGDEDCLKILKRCKEVIPSKDKGGKVIIVDMIIDTQKQDKESVETQLCTDMFMMSVLSVAKERSLKEWNKLFLEAGFTHYKATPIIGHRSLIELYP
ncbi:trans-resveratrol di-O-methyltransferase-like [Pistacia vera]|uniref:trans-resveratrol di-O-methyltransferase-like n=1 Tax=Pistacia vera TaxID=55513 RepID=UPI001262FDA5|nr:trans-resveratrol di-O-methyltransferase-like [Pistacia vera]